MEEWRDIKGYEGLYQISSFGRVKSLNYNRTGKSKIMKNGTVKGGYKNIQLSKNGKIKVYLIHRLVAEAFIPNSNNLPEINHKDAIVYNNNVFNLEWCNHYENINENNRLTHFYKKVKCITTGEVFSSVKEASIKYNIARSSISHCCIGNRKSAGKHPITGEKMIWVFMKGGDAIG